MAALSGTVTLLFTDIDGSVGWWETAPESVTRALGRHDKVPRSSIEAHVGHAPTGSSGPTLR